MILKIQEIICAMPNFYSKYFKIFYSLIIYMALNLVIVTPSLVLAYEKKPDYGNYCEYANFLTQNGQERLATKEYIKALLVNLNNTQAKQALKKIVTSSKSFTIKQRSLLHRYINLLDFLTFLTQRIYQIEAANLATIEFIAQHIDSGESAELAMIATIKKGRNLNSFPEILHIFENDDPNFQLEGINRKLVDKKENFTILLEDMQSTHDKLRKMKRQIIANYKKVNEVYKNDKLQHQIDSLESKIEEKDNYIIKQERILDVFSQQLTDVRLEFDVVKERIQETDEKVVHLTRELAAMSLSAYEKDRILADKEDETQLLKDDLMDANQRINLMQKVIIEKDDIIQNLEQEVDKINIALNQRSSNDELIELKTSFSHLKKSMRSEALENRTLMGQLRTEFQNLQKRYLVLEKNLKLKNSQISKLSATLSEKDKKLEQMEEISTSKDHKLMELSGILEIYKSRLAEVHNHLEHKTEILQKLEEKLSQINHKFESEQPEDSNRAQFNQEIIHHRPHAFPLSNANIYQRTKKNLSTLLRDQ